MQSIVKLKLVIFRIETAQLVVYAPNNLLPSVTLAKNISLEQQVEKLFSESLNTSLNNCYSEQLFTISDDNEISIVYYILLPENNTENQNAWIHTKKNKGKEYN